MAVVPIPCDQDFEVPAAAFGPRLRPPLRRHIQAILGHATITSTELYTHVSLEDLKEVVRRANPHGKKDR